MRPKPREAPVINHVFFILIPLNLAELGLACAQCSCAFDQACK
jgi:hypothetical protein